MSNHRTLSLVIAAVAIVSLLAGTAGARYLITGRDVKNGSLTGADIKDRSLTAADFRGSVQGPQGAPGQTGPAGPPGTSGLSDVRTVLSTTLTVPPGGSTFDVQPSWTANCPSGYTVIGTGFSANFGDMWRVESYGTFVGGFGTNYASISGDFELQAICAKVSAGASAASVGTAARREVAAYRKDMERLQTLHERSR